MTQKKTRPIKSEKKSIEDELIFDAAAARAELLEAFKRLPKEDLRVMKEIQADFLKYAPAKGSIVDELLRDRKREK